MTSFGQNYPLITKDISYYGKDFFRLEGTLIPDSLKQNRYDRLPISYKEIVQKTCMGFVKIISWNVYSFYF